MTLKNHKSNFTQFIQHFHACTFVSCLPHQKQPNNDQSLSKKYSINTQINKNCKFSNVKVTLSL